MDGLLDVDDLGPEKTAHLYRLTIALLITILIIPTQRIESVEATALAIGLGAAVALVHVLLFDGFTDPVSTTVRRREILLTVVAIAVGAVLVFFLPADALVAVIHGALGYVWMGSVAAALLAWRDDAE